MEPICCSPTRASDPVAHVQVCGRAGSISWMQLGGRTQLTGREVRAGEREEKCLSQHKPLPRHFQGSCVALGRGSGLSESQNPLTWSCPLGKRHTKAHVHTLTGDQCFFPRGQFWCPALGTSGTYFLGGPGGEVCIPGIMFSQRGLRGQLASVFKCTNSGHPSAFSAACRA